MVSMMGNTQIDSRIDVPMLVSCSHWHALKMDIDMQVWRTSVSDATLKRLAAGKLATLPSGVRQPRNPLWLRHLVSSTRFIAIAVAHP